MFGNKEGKPVDIVIIENTFIDGEFAPMGTEIKAMAADLAMELAGGGKAAVAGSQNALAAIKAAKALAKASKTASVSASSPEDKEPISV